MSSIAVACFHLVPLSMSLRVGSWRSHKLSLFVQNKMHINDWSSIQSLFDKLNKQMEKTLKTEDILGAPRPYIRLLHELENFISKSWDDKPAKKKMSATNSRALTTMRQRVKKHNAGYQKELLDFSLHPVSSSENEQEGEKQRKRLLESSPCFNNIIATQYEYIITDASFVGMPD